MKEIYAMLFIAMLVVAGFADAGVPETETEGFDKLTEVFCKLAYDLKTIMGPIAFLLIVMAAVIYGGGQLGDAQLRAKAQGWAVMAIIGAVVAFVLMTVGPIIINSMFGDKCTGYEGGFGG